MLFYSDSFLGNMVNDAVGLGLIKLSQYTYPERIVFAEGTMTAGGLHSILGWMLQSAEKGYFMNLKYLEFTGHNFGNELVLQEAIKNRLAAICENRFDFPNLDRIKLTDNGVNQLNLDLYGVAFKMACKRNGKSYITLDKNPAKQPNLCKTALSGFETNYRYYNMSKTAEVSQCRNYWSWELGDTTSSYSSGPYTSSNTPAC